MFYRITGKQASVPCRGFDGPCDVIENVKWENSRTAYHWGHTRAEHDPNAPIPLCRKCAKAHHKYWDEMWVEYYWDRL